MLHFVIGTKAQFIKMVPVMRVAENRGIAYQVIDLTQHGGITGRILDDFSLHPHILRPLAWRGNVETYRDAIRWSLQIFGLLLVSRRKLNLRLETRKGEIVLVHGDTLSTLFGLMLAKRAGLRTGLVEAGLTSGRLFNPFPEEAIRRTVERFAIWRFAPGARPAAALRQRGFGNVVDTGYNTGRDTTLLALQNIDQTARCDRMVITLHRLEALRSKDELDKRITHILNLVTSLGPADFYLHGPTERALRKHDLLERLRTSPGVSLHPLLPYPDFIRRLATARAILTDGGSIQEEASYLGIPCLVLRDTTEREEGLDSNVRLASFDVDRDLEFLRDTASTPRRLPETELQASRRILETLQDSGLEDGDKRPGLRGSVRTPDEIDGH